MRSFAGTLGLGLLLCVLLGLLSWLLLREIDTDAPAHAAIQRTLDDLALAEAELQRDVLRARAGLLRNYDPIVDAVEEMERAAARLRAQALAEGVAGAPAERLVAVVAEQAQLVERFKSGNALLQNSLAYVGLLSTSPSFAVQDTQLAAATGALAAAIAYLQPEPAPEDLGELQARIDRFTALAPSGGADAEAARALLAHVRLLQQVVPDVDGTLRSLVAMPGRPVLADLRTVLAARRAEVEATAYRFRLLLYFVSLLLLVLLVHLGLRLRV